MQKKKCGVSSPCCISLENGFRTGFEEFMHAVLRLLKDFRWLIPVWWVLFFFFLCGRVASLICWDSRTFSFCLILFTARNILKTRKKNWDFGDFIVILYYFCMFWNIIYNWKLGFVLMKKKLCRQCMFTIVVKFCFVSLSEKNIYQWNRFRHLWEKVLMF